MRRCAFVPLFLACSAVRPPPPALDGVPALLAKHGVSSVSIARVERGEVVFAAAYGLQRPGVPATAATLYNIASLTKPLSAEVVLRLAARGQLSLDEPMAPTWVDPDVAADARRLRLTPRLALSHQSGLPNWRPRGKPLAFERAPGEAFGYSGEGYEWVARFAEHKTGTTFETLAQRLVFDPAHLRETAYTQRPWFAERVAWPSLADGRWLEPTVADHFYASDLVTTTPSDYATFLISVMKHEGVTEAVAAERQRVQVSRRDELCPADNPRATATCPREVGFGLGWEVYAFEDETFLMHTGMDEGVFTLVYFSPTQRSGTVFFTNSANGPRLVIPLLELLGKDPAFVAFLRTMAP